MRIGSSHPKVESIMRGLISAAVLVGAYAAVQSGSAQAPLYMVRSIELPRVEGRIDHLALDPTSDRLFVAALGNNSVEVVDVKNGQHLKSLTGFREPQGIAVATDAKVVAVANGQGSGIQLLNKDDYQLGGAVRLGDDS